MMFTCLLSRFVVFFFKQKTAYEMRISDWSSDVCSSDLPRKWIKTPRARARGRSVAACVMGQACAPAPVPRVGRARGYGRARDPSSPGRAVRGVADRKGVV